MQWQVVKITNQFSHRLMDSDLMTSLTVKNSVFLCTHTFGFKESAPV